MDAISEPQKEIPNADEPSYVRNEAAMFCAANKTTREFICSQAKNSTGTALCNLKTNVKVGNTGLSGACETKNRLGHWTKVSVAIQFAKRQ